MTAYLIAHLRPSAPHEDIATYIERIQDTMAPFGGHFLIHGTEAETLEGRWPGSVVMIAFPDVEAARTWYASPAYQELLPLRTRHIDGDVILVAGITPGYDPRDTARAMRAGLAATDGE